jgi:hypothetical protein
MSFGNDECPYPLKFYVQPVFLLHTLLVAGGLKYMSILDAAYLCIYYNDRIKITE